MKKWLKSAACLAVVGAVTMGMVSAVFAYSESGDDRSYRGRYHDNCDESGWGHYHGRQHCH